jgi:tetratricopeptide (TPR) repeat protein
MVSHAAEKKVSRRRVIVASFAAASLFLCAPSWFGAQSFGADSRVYKLFEEGKKLLDGNDPDKALEAFSEVLRLMPANDPDRHLVLLARANAYLRKKDIGRARADLNEAFRGNGLDDEARASALNLRGGLNVMSGRYESAFKDFTAAIKIVHENNHLRAVSFANRGKVHVDLGRYDAALSDFDKALELDPASAYSYAGKGLAYVKLDRIDSARRAAERALAMKPSPETAALAKSVLDSISFARTGPDAVEVPIGADGHVFVQVRFGKNGKPRRFMLDTGATHSLISQDLLESVKSETSVVHMGTGRVMTADGAVHVVQRYRISAVFLYNFPLEDIEAHVMPGKRALAANLLGAHSLKNLRVSIDASEKKAEIRRTDVKPTPTGQ